MVKEENEYLKTLIELEDLAEKKTKIYSRLLMEAGLAGEMESLSARHAKRKQEVSLLLYGEPQKRKSSGKQGGKSATKEEEYEAK